MRVAPLCAFTALWLRLSHLQLMISQVLPLTGKHTHSSESTCGPGQVETWSQGPNSVQRLAVFTESHRRRKRCVFSLFFLFIVMKSFSPAVETVSQPFSGNIKHNIRYINRLCLIRKLTTAAGQTVKIFLPINHCSWSITHYIQSSIWISKCSFEHLTGCYTTFSFFCLTWIRHLNKMFQESLKMFQGSLKGPQQHHNTMTQRHDNTTTPHHDNTSTPHHDSTTTTPQHNNTTPRQHNNTTPYNYTNIYTQYTHTEVRNTLT